MSTLHSTPPPAGHPHHPVGFNEQTYYDPFFPSSPSDEHLAPFNSDRPQSRQSCHSSSARTSNLYDEGIEKSNSPVNDFYQPQPQHPPSISLTNGFDTSSLTHSHSDVDDANAPYGFLSPNPYLSENEYNASSEYTATPEYGNELYLEDDFGLLANPNQELELNISAAFENGHPRQISAEIDSLYDSNNDHRTSLGAATLSSQLMSPVLTNSEAPTSRNGTVSPPMATNYAKSEGLHQAATPNTRRIQQANLNPRFPLGQMQRTPTVTESSNDASPGLTQVAPNIAPTASPVVRVETYTRGDSPTGTRSRSFLGSGGRKRSREGRNSPYLEVQQDDDDAFGEDEEEDGSDHTAKNGSMDSKRFAAQGVTRTGLDPPRRIHISNVEIPNLKDQEDTAQRELKNADVADWLDRSASGSEAGADMPPRKPSVANKRQRARSAGAQSLSQANLESLKATRADSHIPGPGILVDEESGEEESEDDDIASIEDSPPPTIGVDELVNEIPGEAKPGVYNELAEQPPLYRAKLWQDPIYDSSVPGVKMQPVSSNDAIRRFEQRAGDIETLSRVATWGTRRLSESDVTSLFSRFTFRRTESAESGRSSKGKRDRSSSFLEQAKDKLLSRRRNTLKRQESEGSKSHQATRPTTLEHGWAESSGSFKESLNVPQPSPKGLKRMSSLGKRPKSPRLNTGVAIAIAGQMAALGGSGTAASSPTGGWASTKNVINRVRSRSDLNSKGLGLYVTSPSASEMGLAELWKGQGGPPLPTLARPTTEQHTPMFHGFHDPEDEDDEDAVDDHGITMDLSIRPDSIVPTLEGFKANIRLLNPRLPSFMFDRIAQEQLRRFKKLMDFKIKHTQALGLAKCPSRKFCTESGGEPTYLPSKSSSREPEMSHTGFSVTGIGPSDEDANALAEGIVTPAQFPPGVPMPPVKRLPAELECSLCFKVKKFHKPSDWSKHVHEDVQPFTCTFATCAEPKSFKRKADWVRHENERHRQLEWWMCNMNDCSHKCYRKDNFVQHLVREHKLPEPKIKTSKAGKPAVRGPSAHKARNNKQADDHSEDSDEVDQVWRLVEECRHETPKNPKDEACKFCGNICNSWKKLTVHLAKHMEQISMPVLGVVKEREVTPDTIISPIDARMASHPASMSPTIQSPFSQTHPTSPYGVHVMSSNEMSGTFNSLRPGYFNDMSDQQSMGYQRVSPNTYPPPTHAQQLATGSAQHRRSPFYASDYSSTVYSGSPPPQFVSVNPRGYSQPHTSSPENMYTGLCAPTSQPRSSPYEDANNFQYVTQQQQSFSSPVEAPMYQLPGSSAMSYPQNTSTPTSYPQPRAVTPASYPQQRAVTPASYPQPRAVTPNSYPQPRAVTPNSYPQPRAVTPNSYPQQRAVTPNSYPQQSAATPISYPQQGTPPMSYSQQQAMGTPSPTYPPQQAAAISNRQYNNMQQMKEYAQANGDPSLYNQQQQQAFVYGQP